MLQVRRARIGYKIGHCHCANIIKLDIYGECMRNCSFLLTLAMRPGFARLQS
jgi:hypothetical protein